MWTGGQGADHCATHCLQLNEAREKDGGGFSEMEVPHMSPVVVLGAWDSGVEDIIRDHGVGYMNRTMGELEGATADTLRNATRAWRRAVFARGAVMAVVGLVCAWLFLRAEGRDKLWQGGLGVVVALVAKVVEELADIGGWWKSLTLLLGCVAPALVSTVPFIGLKPLALLVALGLSLMVAEVPVNMLLRVCHVGRGPVGAQ